MNELGDRDENEEESISENPSIIHPLLYTFKVSQDMEAGSVITATIPPYWLYHDHAFGVIWTLFCKNKQYIGISQLHWCLKFLLDLKNSSGEFTIDVEICIKAIENNLIEQYAVIGSVFNEGILKDLQNNVKEGDLIDHDHQNIDENKSKLGATNNSVKKIICGKDCSKETEEQTLSNLLKRITSITYDEMKQRGSKPCIKESDKQFKMLPNHDKVQESANDTNPKETVASLNSSRQICINNIKMEIKKLHRLEILMQSLDADSFDAYITADLETRLDNLENQEVVTEIEKII